MWTHPLWHVYYYTEFSQYLGFSLPCINTYLLARPCGHAPTQTKNSTSWLNIVKSAKKVVNKAFSVWGCAPPPPTPTVLIVESNVLAGTLEIDSDTLWYAKLPLLI